MLQAKGRTSIRGAAAVVLVAALLIGATSATADAGVESAEWPDGIRLLHHDDPIDRDEISAMAEHEGVSRAEAERRLRLENAVPALQFAAEEAAPDTFGGVWVDRDPFRVVVAYTEDAQQHVAALAAGFPDPDVVEAITVERARWELRALTATILGERHLLEDSNPPDDMPEELVATGGYYTIWTDLRANVVGISLEDPSPALQQAVAERYDPSIVIEDARVVPNACNTSSCNGRFVGGVETRLSTSLCTLGFNTYSGGKFNAMSAGHCTRDSNGNTLRRVRNSSGSLYHYGSVSDWATWYDLDAEVIRATAVDDAHVRSEPRIVADNRLRDIAGYVSYSNMAPGIHVGKTGYTTGTTRGDIIKVDVAPSYISHAEAKFIQTKACSANGDSGGPTFRNNDIWGIHSGGSYYNGNGCGSDGQAIFGAVNFALAALNQNLVTTSDPGPPANPNKPPKASYTQSCLLMRCQFDASASSDSDGWIVNYRWEFGDGTVVNDSDPYYTYTYTLPGFYDTRLVVTDDDGAKGTASKQILVSE